jgi:general secretion pathway protein N
MIDRLAVYLLIAGSLLFASLIVVELDGGVAADAALTEVPLRADAAPAAPQPVPRVELEDLLRVALARPLFSATRRPPQTEGNAATDPGLTDTRLTGIVTEPDHRVAIFAITGAKPVALTEGETVSGWRIDSISPREVSLSGPGGTKILQPRIDQDAVAQPRSPPAGAGAGRGVAGPAPPRPGAAPVPGARPPPAAPSRNPAAPPPRRPAPTGQQR